MNKTEIITLILTSSLISAILTGIVNWLIQKKNYKNEYYKKLLDKRINAYEEVEELAAKLTAMVLTEKGPTCNLFCHMGYDYFTEFLIYLRLPMRKSFWLSDTITQKLTELNILLIEEIDNKIVDNDKVDQQLIDLGIKNVDKIGDIRKALEKELYKDFQGLHNIKKFIMEIKSDETYTIQRKSV